MISVIVYGRNDSHGNNVAKRAAVSLNSIAAILDDVDDEILFVDYNTPDDLPTFPESIADTLTPKARQRLQIFRVRPHHHQSYLPFTSLKVIESLARNVALRRANQRNRWVLSTNTDMVFLLREPRVSLSEIAAGLDDGLYHIPRFEVPERMWQDFDRMDPKANMSVIDRWASSLGLNTVVYGYPDTVFDYAGDFQLLPLSQLKDMCGFDERMLLRGECDPNIARRMALLGYPAKSLAHEVTGYHCSHVRGKCLTRSDRANNDIVTFYLEVNHPKAEHQDGVWGLAEKKIEKRTLTENGKVMTNLGDSYPKLVHGMLKKNGAREPNIVPYHMSAREMLCYTSKSISAYIADLLWELPRSLRISYIGRNPVMFEQLCRLSKQMRFERVPLQLGDLAAKPDDLPGGSVVVFDLGLDADEMEEVSVAELIHSLAPLEADFEALVQREKEGETIGERLIRRVVFINFEFSWLYARISREFTVDLLPKASRLAYGFYLPYRFKQSNQSSAGIWPVSREQASRADELLRLLLKRVEVDEPIDIGPDELSYPVLRALDTAVAEDNSTYSKDSLIRLNEYAKVHRPSALFRNALHVELRTKKSAAPPLISKVCDCADWEDPLWYGWWKKICGASCAENMFSWSGTTWLRTQVMYALDRLGMLKEDLSVLILSDQFETIPFLLFNKKCRVDIINVHSPEPATEEMAVAVTKLRDYRADIPAYDIIILMGEIFDADGFESVVPRLSIVSRWLEIDGVLLYGKNILLTDQYRSKHLEGSSIASESFQQIVESVGSLSLIGPFDFSIDEKSLDCCSGLTKHYGKPSLVTGAKGALAVSSLWAWRKIKTKKEWANSAVKVLNSVKGGLLSPFVLDETNHGRAKDGSVWVDNCDDGCMKLSTRWLPLCEGKYLFRLSNLCGDNKNEEEPGITIVVSNKDGKELSKKIYCATVREPNDYSIVFNVDSDALNQWKKIKIELLFRDFLYFQMEAAYLGTIALCDNMSETLTH